MTHFLHQLIVGLIICTITLLASILASQAQNTPPKGVIYPVAELVTLSEARGNAVYVLKDRIAAIGQKHLLTKTYPQAQLDTRYSDKVMVPGFIEHHVHPFLAAIALSSEVIAIEDWHLPDGIKSGVRERTAYLKMLGEAAAKKNQPLFVSWGFHHYFHGKLTRQDLDKISPKKPIIVIHRSFHEFIMNSAALALTKITQADIETAPASARPHMSLEKGHFAEQGAVAVMAKLLAHIAPPQTFLRGLYKTRNFLHENGVTLIVNPGAFSSAPIQQAKNHVFGDNASPFRSLFMVNGMFLIQNYGTKNLPTRTKELMKGGKGRLQYVPKKIKLFTDGAIFSQAMQMRDGYLDGHEGAWLMEKETFRTAFRIYWEAGYQIHVHQNGDAGLDLLLDTLAENMARNPRSDHRTVIVHFGYAAADQVARIKKLGALVSANPYYVTALSDLYARKGVGVARTRNMVRLGDVSRAGVPVALHSDMPMAPAAPLFLMHQAVTRVNFAGNIIGRRQRLSAAQALHAVTLGAAYMMGLENDYGSIAVGKLANFTLLEANPLRVAPDKIKQIGVSATMVEGKHFPIHQGISKSLPH